MKGFGKGGKTLTDKTWPAAKPNKGGTQNAKPKGGFMPFKKKGK